MKDFINPINDNDTQKLYDLLKHVILITNVGDDEFIKKDEFSNYYHEALQYAKDKELPFPKTSAKVYTRSRIKSRYLDYLFNCFILDDYCKFYTLGQFQKMLNQAIDKYINENYD